MQRLVPNSPYDGVLTWPATAATRAANTKQHFILDLWLDRRSSSCRGWNRSRAHTSGDCADASAPERQGLAAAGTTNQLSADRVELSRVTRVSKSAPPPAAYMVHFHFLPIAVGEAAMGGGGGGDGPAQSAGGGDRPRPGRGRPRPRPRPVQTVPRPDRPVYR